MIFSGMFVVEVDLACCLHFEPEIDCFERCALTFLVQAAKLDNLLPLTTIFDNKLYKDLGSLDPSVTVD